MKTLMFLLRNSNQFISYSLNWHLMIKANKAVLNSDTGTVEIHSIKKKSLLEIKGIIKSCEMNKSVFAINIQDINQASGKSQKYLIEWIENILK